MALFIAESHQIDWYHMVPNSEVTLTSADEYVTVRLADGSEITVTGSGIVVNG